VRPISFEEMASKVMDIENYMQHITQQPRSFNKPMEKSGQRDKLPTKPKSAQAMEAKVSPPQFHPRSITMRNQENRDAPTPRRPTLSEHQNREYSFLAEEVEDIFMGLRELNLIELPKPKNARRSLRVQIAKFLSLPPYCDMFTPGLIGLIEYSYHQGLPSFLKAHLQRTLRLSMLGPEKFQDG
jgi:hypothetical protein